MNVIEGRKANPAVVEDALIYTHTHTHTHTHTYTHAHTHKHTHKHTHTHGIEVNLGSAGSWM